jgi:hypothetical protein
MNPLKMFRSGSARAPDVPAAPPPTRLEAAHAKLNGAHAEINALRSRAATLEAAVAPARAAATALQSARQERDSVLSRQLEIGQVNHEAPELVDATSKLQAAEAEAAKHDGVISAQAPPLSDLHSQIAARSAWLPDMARELMEARFEAATTEIQQALMPQVRAAAEQLGDALAALYGAGIAHTAMATELRASGCSAQALGVEYPQRAVELRPVGFGFTDTGNFNTLRVDLDARITSATAAALARWKNS